MQHGVKAAAYRTTMYECTDRLQRLSSDYQRYATYPIGSAQPGGRNVHLSNPFATGVTLASQAPTNDCCSKECVFAEEHVRIFGCECAVSELQEDGESWNLGEVWGNAHPKSTVSLSRGRQSCHSYAISLLRKLSIARQVCVGYNAKQTWRSTSVLA